MDVNYLKKTKSSLENLIKCLEDRQRKGFHNIISVIKSLMFNGADLKVDFSMIIPEKAAGDFPQMIWDINYTGAYYGAVINGYNVLDVVEITREIINAIDCEILKEIETDNKNFLTNLLTACSLMQSNYYYHDTIDENGKEYVVKEDYRNYYLRDLFDFKGLYVRGQEHQGSSPSGRAAGEVDLLICHTELQEKIYVEGMNLHSLEAGTINDHYNKLFDYDASLNKNNFLVSYVVVSDFEDFLSKYKKHFEKYQGENKCESIAEETSDLANIKVLISKSIHRDKNNKHISYTSTFRKIFS